MSNVPDDDKRLGNAIGGASLIALVLVVIVLAQSGDWPSRIQAATGVIGVFGTIAAAAAATMALRQLELQRQGLREQQRAIVLERFSAVRGEYARWLGVAHDVMVKLKPTALVDVGRGFDELDKLSFQIALTDRSAERADLLLDLRTIFAIQRGNAAVPRLLLTRFTQVRDAAFRHDDAGSEDASLMETANECIEAMRRAVERATGNAGDGPYPDPFDLYALRLTAFRCVVRALGSSLMSDESRLPVETPTSRLPFLGAFEETPSLGEE